MLKSVCLKAIWERGFWVVRFYLTQCFTWQSESSKVRGTEAIYVCSISVVLLKAAQHVALTWLSLCIRVQNQFTNILNDSLDSFIHLLPLKCKDWQQDGRKAEGNRKRWINEWESSAFSSREEEDRGIEWEDERGSGQILQTESEHAWVTSCVSLYVCKGERKSWKKMEIAAWRYCACIKACLMWQHMSVYMCEQFIIKAGVFV